MDSNPPPKPVKPSATSKSRHTRAESIKTHIHPPDFWTQGLPALRQKGLVDDEAGTYSLPESHPQPATVAKSSIVPSRVVSSSPSTSAGPSIAPTPATSTSQTRNPTPIINRPPTPRMVDPLRVDPNQPVAMTQVQLEAMMANIMIQMREELRREFREEIRQNVGPPGEPGAPGPPGPPGPQGPAGIPGAAMQVGPHLDQRWRIEEFGLFEPDLAVDDKYPPGDLITAGKDTIFRNVDAFCERIKDMAKLRGLELVRDNLHMCLRGAAVRWWTFEVSELDKQAIRQDRSNDLQQWTGRLTTRFRPPLSQAMRDNQSLTFQVADVRNGNRVLNYFQTKVLRAKASGFETIHQQLMQVYMGLDVVLRLNLFEPTPQTTLDQYREILQQKEELWIEAYTIRRRGYQSPYEFFASSPQQYSRSQFTPPRQNQYNSPQLSQSFRRQSQAFPTPSPQRPALSPVAAGKQPATNEESEYCPIHLSRGQRYKHPVEKCRFVTEYINKMQQLRISQAQQRPGPSRPSSTPIIEPINYVDAYETPSQMHNEDDGSGFYALMSDGIPQDLYSEESTLMDHPMIGDYPDDEGAASYLLHQPDDSPLIFCRGCLKSFPSRNRLFKHLDDSSLRCWIQRPHRLDLRKRKSTHPSQPKRFFDADANLQIIESQSQPVSGNGLAFKGYNYAEFDMRFFPNANDFDVCADTGCSMTCIDEGFFRKMLPATEVKSHQPVNIKGVKGAGISTRYAVLDFYIPGKKNGESMLAHMRREFHLVKDLGCNILVGNDILEPEAIVIDPSKGIMSIGSCDMTSPIRIRKKEPFTSRLVRVAATTTIPPKTAMVVPVKVAKALTEERDYNFRQCYDHSSSWLALHGHFPEGVVDKSCDKVIYYNTSDKRVRVPKQSLIGEISEFDYNERATPEDPEVAHGFFSAAKIIPSLAVALQAGITAYQYASSSQPTLPDHTIDPVFPAIDPTAISAYSLLPPTEPGQGDPKQFGSAAVHINMTDDISPQQVKELQELLQEFEGLWEDRVGRIIEPEEDWLTIPLKPGAVIESKGRYRVSKRDEAFIDEIFDQARADGRLSAVQGVVSAGWPVFVVWQKGKGRVVIDLRSLNDKVVKDAYPLPLQQDICAELRGKTDISSVDLQKAFYQRLVALFERWKLTVKTHRGLEMFNVCPTGFVNSPGHMQKFMDKKLEPHKEYARCYIDNIVIYSDNFEDHKKHLRAVLGTLLDCGMTLGPDKCYVGFHSIDLLGHKVDRFGLTTLKEKMDAIASLQFPKVLAQLDYFLGLTGFYRSYVARYASLSEPLHSLKTKLLKGCPRKGPPRQQYSRSKKIVNPTQMELTSFQILKDAMCELLSRYHEDPSLPLLYNVDSSGEGFACAIHQVPRHVMDEHNLSFEDILNGNYDRILERPVLYLSRLLSKYEVNYWPTELEIAGIVWVLQKTRHMMEGSVAVKVYTDHKSAEDVLNSRNFKTTSSVRQNLRLIRASQFVSQYPNVKIIYRPGKDNVNADALSRLIALRDSELAKPDEDSDVYGFTITAVGFSPETLLRFEAGYKADKHFKLIFETVKKRMEKRDVILNTEIAAVDVTTSDLFRRLDREAPEDVEINYGGFQGRKLGGHILLYLKGPKDMQHRLCIPRSCQLDFLRSAHDSDGTTHVGFDKAYERLRHNYYIYKLPTLLKQYINSCPSCQRNKPTHHKPYGELQPIESPQLPFEFITMDFVTGLPRAKFQGSEYDAFMSVTCKLSKVVSLILGLETYTAEQWADAFYHGYYRKWGVPSRILSDRGSVFLSQFWTTLWRILRTNLMVTTAYHPQADGQSERTNQTVEIALRHLVAAHHKDWPVHLTEVEYTINNVVNATLGCTPMQYIFGLDPHTTLDWAALNPGTDPPSTKDWVERRRRYRDEAMDSIVFAQAKMRYYYDLKHMPMEFRPGDKVYITLASGAEPGYRLPASISDKLSERRVDPFEVINPVGRLSYKLDIPSHWRIHPVISIAHLEPHVPDIYDREIPAPPEIIDDEEGQHEEFEVEDIVRKRYNKRSKRWEYFVKWKNYGSHRNTWEPLEHLLPNAADKVDQFEAAQAQAQILSTLVLPARPPPPHIPFYKTNLL